MDIPADMPRTSCACKHCCVGCKTMPGSLIPGDLERIQEYVGDPSTDFVLNNFWVSEGAKVAKTIGKTVYTFHVPSIVPAQTPDGRCVFLNEDDRCTIHPVSPFGCSRCDSHMDDEEAVRRVTYCVSAQIDAHKTGAPYSQTCQLLDSLNLRAKPLVERKADMRTATEALG